MVKFDGKLGSCLNKPIKASDLLVLSSCYKHPMFSTIFGCEHSIGNGQRYGSLSVTPVFRQRAINMKFSTKKPLIWCCSI